MFQHTAARRRLQGWEYCVSFLIYSFNTQPRGGGCRLINLLYNLSTVSTHSRAEAAALVELNLIQNAFVSTHSRAEAAAGRTHPDRDLAKVSTHSRAEAAAYLKKYNIFFLLFQHTAARRRLLIARLTIDYVNKFQHTAARRRLHIVEFFLDVS